MENNKEKDSTKKLTIVVIILIVVVLVLGGFIVYKEFIANDKTGQIDDISKKDKSPNVTSKATPDVNKTKNLDLSDATVQKLYGYFVYPNGTKQGQNLGYGLFAKNMNGSSFSDEEKMIYAFNILSTTDIVNQPKQANDWDRFVISETAMDDAMTRFFGPNITYNKTKKYNWSASYSFQTASIISLNYNASTKQFEGTYSGAGGDDDVVNIYGKLISASQTGDTITLKEKYVIQQADFDTNSGNWTQSIYKNNADGNKIVLSSKPLTTELQRLTQTEIDAYLNQGGTITYTFKKDTNGNYYYESSTLEV